MKVEHLEVPETGSCSSMDEGDIMLIDTPDIYKGLTLLRIYERFVILETPNQTWESFNKHFIGKIYRRGCGHKLILTV